MGIKVSVAVTEYLQMMEKQGATENTLMAYGSPLYRFAKSVRDMQVGNLTPQHVEDWFYGPRGLMGDHMTGLGKKGSVSVSTHHLYRARLHSFFVWCDRKRYTPKDVDLLERIKTERQMKAPRRRRQQPKPAVLLEILDAAANPRDRAWIAMALNTAMRSSEIRCMTYADLDLESGWIYADVIKTKEVDDMPINSDLDREMRRWILAYETDLGRPLRHDDYLFPSRRGGMFLGGKDADGQPRQDRYRWDPTTAIVRTERIVKPALAALGLPTRYEGTHTLRRAVALAYFRAAAAADGEISALRETSLLLHHSSLSTTEGYLGTNAEKEARNDRLRGKPFLTAMVDKSNVTKLRSVEGQ